MSGETLVARISTDDESRALIRNGHTLSSMLADRAPVIKPVNAEPTDVDGQVVSLFPMAAQLQKGKLNAHKTGSALRQLHDAFPLFSIPNVATSDPGLRLRVVVEIVSTARKERPINRATDDLCFDFVRAANQIAQETSEMFNDATWWGISHGDVWPGNIVLVDGNIHWIDLDAGGQGSVLTDFSQFAFAVPTFSWPSNWLDAFFDGYGRRPSANHLQNLVRFNSLIWISSDVTSALRTGSPEHIQAARQNLGGWLAGAAWVTPVRPIPQKDYMWEAPLKTSLLRGPREGASNDRFA